MTRPAYVLVPEPADARTGPAMDTPPQGTPAAAGPPRPQDRRTPDRAAQDVLAARLRAKDPEALREVVALFAGRITSVVSNLVHDRDAVDDVVQETFVKAFYRIRSFHGDSGLYTWLYRVAVNAAKDHLKRMRRRPAAPLDEEVRPLAAPGAPALERLEDRERRVRVRAAMDALPPKFRTVLVLREVEGLRYDEIADVLALSVGTVESRLFRARQRLLVRLRREGFA
jgi:RNA polymerase sigma-70 factor (ECF subfamily)